MVLDNGILQDALFKDKCGFIIVSFQRMSVSIIWMCALHILRFFFLNTVLYKDVKAFFGNVRSILRYCNIQGHHLWNCGRLMSAEYGFSYFFNLLIHLCTQLFKRNESLYSLRSWEFKDKIWFLFLGRKVKHKYADESVSKMISNTEVARMGEESALDFVGGMCFWGGGIMVDHEYIHGLR